MFFSKYSVLLICCDNYKNDSLIQDLYNTCSSDCETALNAYSSLCFRLSSKGVTLSDYIFNLIVGADNPMIKEYIKNRDDVVYNSLCSDITVLSAVSRIKSEDIVSYLTKEFDLYELNFPVYETGDTVITIDTVMNYISKYGSSLYADNKAFVLESGVLKPAENVDAIRLSELKNYDIQRNKLIENTLCLLNGAKAQNALLYGDRGTGKSSTIKAIANEYDGIRIIQVHKNAISDIYSLYERIRCNPLKFIIFIDDITFSEDDEDYSFFKQILEGSVVKIPGNCVIYATTNRRHVIKGSAAERAENEIHAADARDENMSLIDRFGLYITFISPDRAEYLDIVHQLALDREIDIPYEKMDILAERYALKKCGRSPRTAKQFIDMLKTRIDMKMEFENL